MSEQNKPTAEDWLNFPEEDSKWLDEALQQANEADLDWLLPLDALKEQDTPLTINTSATTASLGVPPTTKNPSESPPDDLLPEASSLFDPEVLPWDSLDEFAQSPEYEAIRQSLGPENSSLEELETWEKEALQITQDLDTDWTAVPSSHSAIALEETVEEDEETRAFAEAVPPTYEFQEVPESFSTADDAGDTMAMSAPPPMEQMFFQGSGEVEEFHFVPEDAQLSEFDIARLEQQGSVASASASYLDNFELKTEDINIDIDLEDLGNPEASLPLHETFEATAVPPLPPLPPISREEPSTGGKWANPAKQMSTGLNPDRRPFEPAPPSLITNASPTKAGGEIDIFDLDENTDWSGLLEEDTVVSEEDALTPPTPVKPKEVPNTPPDVLYQEVRQFQELLNDSNLSSVNVVPPVEEPPLHSREVVQPEAKPRQPLTIPALPWGMIAKFAGIAMGAIAVLWLGGTVFNRPLTELGLRTGLWKSASGKDLRHMVLNNANLENANLSGSNLDGARLQRANLKGANLSQARLNGVTLAGANLRGARLHGASVVFSNLTKADLSLADLSEADLTRANLTGARLNGANLQGTKIGKPNTAEATKLDREALLLWQALNEPAVGRNMSRTNFLGFRFNNADLRRANFSDSNLSFATFENAKLNGANFAGAKLDGANFGGADLSGAFFGDASWEQNRPPQSNGKTICPNGKLGPCRF